MRLVAWCVTAGALFAGHAAAVDFGTPGGPPPANIEEITGILRQDPYDIELLISYGTSKGGSAGHLPSPFATRRRATTWSTRPISTPTATPRTRRTSTPAISWSGFRRRSTSSGRSSSLDPKASFGLDFGEIYKRSVIGVRVYGVPAGEKEALAAFFSRLNDDYHKRARNTEYHDREIKYDYLRLNCAKTIGAAFKLGAGYKDLEVTSARILSGRRVVAAANANLPTEMAMKLIKEWDARGYGLDAVLYKKYGGSTYVDPHEKEKVAFKDLPNRFPSVLSRDFRREQGQYEDFDNLFAGYLLYNVAKYSVRVNDETKLLAIERSKRPMAYPVAAELAARSAKSDSENFRRRILFRTRGTSIEAAENRQLYKDTDEGSRSTSP